jgi:hypothetical protein
MIKQKKGKLKVEINGQQRYISVPAGQANKLHDYLRANRVLSAPPEPAFTGYDSIQLAKDCDPEGVQVLLNAWESSPLEAKKKAVVRAGA